MNSYLYGWGSEIGCEIPSLYLYKDFVVKIVVMDNGYKIYFDGNPLSKQFPFRKSVSTAKYIAVYGGTNGLKWNMTNIFG